MKWGRARVRERWCVGEHWCSGERSGVRSALGGQVGRVVQRTCRRVQHVGGMVHGVERLSRKQAGRRRLAGAGWQPGFRLTCEARRRAARTAARGGGDSQKRRANWKGWKGFGCSCLAAGHVAPWRGAHEVCRPGWQDAQLPRGGSCKDEWGVTNGAGMSRGGEVKRGSLEFRAWPRRQDDLGGAACRRVGLQKNGGQLGGGRCRAPAPRATLRQQPGTG